MAAAAVLLILSCAFFFQARVSTDATANAPDFSANDIDGNLIQMESCRGKVVVLHLAVIYCGGVLTPAGEKQFSEMRAARELADGKAVFITVTSENCPTTDLFAIRQQYNISWAIVNDWPDMNIYGPYAEYFSKHGDPTLVIIDPNGRVTKHTGSASAEDIDRAVDAARAGTAAPSPVSGELGFAGMFGLGVLTSLAPCSIALLATMLAFLLSRKGSKQKKGAGRPPAVVGLSIGLYFTLGTVFIFILLGFLIGYIGLFVALSPVFFIIAGTVLVLLGLNSAFSFLERAASYLGDKFGRAKGGGGTPGWALAVRKAWARSPEGGALLLGVLFSLAWAPCALSLVLPVIILLLASKVSLLAGGALLFFFGLGHAVPIIPIAMVTETSSAKLSEKYIKAGKVVTVVFGLAVVVMGILFVLRGCGIYLW